MLEQSYCGPEWTMVYHQRCGGDSVLRFTWTACSRSPACCNVLVTAASSSHSPPPSSCPPCLDEPKGETDLTLPGGLSLKGAEWHKGRDTPGCS